jgi:hypothetical protein
MRSSSGAMVRMIGAPLRLMTKALTTVWLQPLMRTFVSLP